MIEATIEEFEGGAWIADIITVGEPASGNFNLFGIDWNGAIYSTSQDGDRILTRIVGGAGQLAKVIPDRWYDGTVSVGKALQDVCTNAGEKFGSGAPGVMLTTYQRQRGSVAQALDAIADAFGLIWWISRDGAVHLQAVRPVGTEARGVRVQSDSDSSVVLVEPVGLMVGGTYEGQPVRHVRWQLRQDRFSAQAYFMPFIFRAPVNNKYDQIYNALVDKQNGDGTVDVIADARFGVTKVQLFCGVPGAKVEVRPGEQVLLGFFGGSPQKPFAVAFGQSSSATKDVARKTDEVTCSLSAANIAAIAGLLVCTAPGNPPTPNPGTVPNVMGTITSGSTRMKVGD